MATHKYMHVNIAKRDNLVEITSILYSLISLNLLPKPATRRKFSACLAPMAELTLAAIALIFPLYDACNTTYKGCQDMRRFGVDARFCLLRLNNQKQLLDEHMRRRMGDLVRRPDPDDTTDPITISIIDQLTVIQTHFANCHEIVANVMSESAHYSS
jgi:hypothetical protein